MFEQSNTPFLYSHEAEFFGFLPIQVLEDLADDVFSALSGSLFTLHTSLRSLTGCPDEVIKPVMERYAALAEKVCEKNFDIFEIYALRNIFRLPLECLAANQALRQRLIEEGGSPGRCRKFFSEKAGQVNQRYYSALQLNALLESERNETEDETRLLDRVSSMLEPLTAILSFEGALSSLAQAVPKLREELAQSITGFRKLQNKKGTRPLSDSFSLLQEGQLSTKNEAWFLEQQNIELLNEVGDLLTIQKYLTHLANTSPPAL